MLNVLMGLKDKIHPIYLLQQHQKSISIFESQIDMFMPRVRMSRFVRVHSTIESPSTTYLTIFPSR